ncbi:sigma-70 family RNA polymerase sigma factor [Streptomyces sp. NPDC101169]|uniref:sigma-70 family RNA polymerase sigma factor n=1 Tax=Streptomyces sp. NPDC101169 TaxID=3366121 RepID=UPI0037F8EEB2
MAGHQEPGLRGVSVTKAALTELMVQLRRSMVGGVVPEAVFLAQAHRLGLREGERERLRDELVRLQVPVQKSVVHTHVDTPDVQKVARKRVETVFPRLDRVWGLLERYADDEGYVTSRSLEGVVRLCGLNAREASALRKAAKVRLEAVPGDAKDEVADEDDPGRADEEATADGDSIGDARVGVEGSARQEPVTRDAQAAELAEVPTRDLPSGPSDMVVPTDADLAAAVIAARQVMDEDRYRRRPEKQLLTAQEEVGLAVLVRGGMSEEPDQDALGALPPDDIRIRARDCLVVHNQGLVHSLVPRYLEQGLDYEDLFQHGALGLMRAARKFDPARGFKFSTYATWWVRQSITRGIADEGSVIRVPVHMHEVIRKVANAERSLATQGRPATAADVAVACDLSLSKVEEARRLSRRTDSLDRVVGDGVTLGDPIARTRGVSSFEGQVHDALLLEDAMAVVNTFSGRDHRILVGRLGLDDEEPLTLDQLGRECGVTRERIRQLESKLVPQLRAKLRQAHLLGASGDASHEQPEPMVTSAHTASSRHRGRPTARAGCGVPDGRAVARPTAVLDDSVSEDVVALTDAPDWDRARRLADSPSGQSWLANYALAALGGRALSEMLGEPAAEKVLRVARELEPADHDVLAALEVIRRVCDGVAQAGLRPGDFLDRPSDALCGVTPRTYITRKPLVHSEPRLALRDALRELLAAPAPLAPAPVMDGAEEEPARAVSVDSVPDAPALIDATPAEKSSAERTPAVGTTGAGASAEESSGEVSSTGLDMASTPLAEPDSAPSDELATAADERDERDERDVVATEAEPDHEAPSVGVAPRVPASTQYTADWDKARELTAPPFGGGVDWLAEYALLAVGHLQLGVLLGPSAANAVVRAAREGGMLNRHVARALEVLESVFDGVKELGLRPEHFLERASEALGGSTPRAFLAAKPLVDNESRYAVRDALREFLAAGTPRKEAEPETADASAPESPPEDAPNVLAGVRAHHEAELARLADVYERRIEEARQAADARVAAASAEGERQLDSLEEILLHRVDKALARQEQHLRRQAEERVTRLKEEHREATIAATRRAQERIMDLEIRLRQSENAASTAAAGHVFQLQARAERAEQRLQQYREEAEARVTQLEDRLRQTEARLIARDRAMYEAGQRAADDLARVQQRAEAGERRAQALVTAASQAEARAAQGEQLAAARLAQVEQDAWARITELQAQLDALQAPAAGRTFLKDRWRRS